MMNFGLSGQLQMASKNIMLCNIFDKKTNASEYLNQVMVTCPGAYVCKVYVNPNGTSKAKKDLQQVALKSGETQTISAGYHMLEFAKPVEIKADSFAVVVEIQNPIGNEVQFYIEQKLQTPESYSKVQTETGKCFITAGNDLDKANWSDLGTLSTDNSALPNGDSTVKAFTTNTLIDESLQSIEITQNPTKTTYRERENFDKTGMVVTAKYNSKINPTKEIDSSKCTILEGEDLKMGTTSVTVSYEGKTATVPVQVTENPLTEMKITTPPTKTNYVVGQTFDKTGMKVSGKYESGITREITDYTIENGNNLTLEQTYVTISSKGKTVTQPITVEDKKTTKIEITTNPKKSEYIQGKEELDLTGGELTVTYNDETTEKLSLDAEGIKVSGFDNSTLGEKTITVTYLEQTAQFTVKIVKENKAKNSDLKNLKSNATKVQAYYYKKDSSKDYTIMNIEITGLEKNTENDKLEYYYYLSTNANEENIENWVKISEEQKEQNKLQFTIDSRNIANYSELAKEDNLYIYVKEVATKGKNQNTAISNAMQLSTDNKIETYVDDEKNTNLDSSTTTTTTTKADTTTANSGKLPRAGMKNLIILTVIIGAIGILIYIRYRNLSKYIK